MSVIFKKSNNKTNFNTTCPDNIANLTINEMFLPFFGYERGKPVYRNETHNVYWDSLRWVYEEIGIGEIIATTSNADYPWLAGFGLKTCGNRYNRIIFKKLESTCPDSTSNIILNGNILLTLNGYSDGKPTYTNGIYLIYWYGLTNRWTCDKIGLNELDGVESNANYPWLVPWNAITIEKQCN